MPNTRDLTWEITLGPVNIRVGATIDEVGPLIIQLVERYPGIAVAREAAAKERES